MIIGPYSTPLRYPGGKTRFAPFIEDLIALNDLDGCTLYELYAGGAGASISTLLSGLCNKVVLNDLDYHIYAFWKCVLEHTDEFILLIHNTRIDVETWERQRYIYDNYEQFSDIEIGFSTFFLNRSNRSGILYRAGPIGGFNQRGNYKIDVRFNKADLINRILKIAAKRECIKIYNKETITYLKYVFNLKNKNKLIFLDPPYYEQGENLYLNFYNDVDHTNLRDILVLHKNENWLLTYDNVDRIRFLYKHFRKTSIDMSYTLQSKRVAKEVAIFSNKLYLPKNLRIGNSISMLKTQFSIK